MISVQVNDKQVQEVLRRLIARGQNLRPAFAEIGKDLVESTKQRFATATAPNGTPWAPNSPVTVARYLGTRTSNFKKDGSLSKQGQANSSAKQPLTGETKALKSTINYQLHGSTGVSMGSPMIYSAMQQFGDTKSKFPNLWGDIPARPFLGVSVKDKANILDILGTYMLS